MGEHARRFRRERALIRQPKSSLRTAHACFDSQADHPLLKRLCWFGKVVKK